VSRPPLPLGTWGKIRRYKLTASTWRATTNFRDYDGHTRQVERTGSTGAKAERRLLEALTNRARVGRLGEISADTRIADIAPVWLEGLRRLNRAEATMSAYEDSLRVHVLKGVGALQVRELTVGVAERFLIAVQEKAGPSAAKHAKTVLSGIMALAARHEAIAHNPLKEVSAIATPRKEARSMTLDEVRTLRAGIRADAKAVDRDLPDLVDFMLGTGLRIGETLAVVWDAVDRVGGQVEVRGTVVRGKDGLKIQPRPKTRSGWRKLHLPDWLAVVLDNREHVETEWDVVFPSQLGKLRDRSNTASDLRDALDPLGFEWATSHTFRKTAATLLDEGGLSVREIADQLGHANVSMTQNVYFGRRQATERAARALDVIGKDRDEKYG
jgi:integrase